MTKTLFVVAVLALGMGSASAAEVRSPAQAAYLRYCSACHGEGGKGDGVASQTMRPHPTDLTALAKSNNGEFPSTKIIRVIDGRDSVRAHGDPNMPVWGEILKIEDGIAQEAKVRGKVALITEYLRTIQAK